MCGGGLTFWWSTLHILFSLLSEVWLTTDVFTSYAASWWKLRCFYFPGYHMHSLSLLSVTISSMDSCLDWSFLFWLILLVWPGPFCLGWSLFVWAEPSCVGWTFLFGLILLVWAGPFCFGWSFLFGLILFVWADPSWWADPSCLGHFPVCSISSLPNLGVFFWRHLLSNLFLKTGLSSGDLCLSDHIVFVTSL